MLGATTIFDPFIHFQACSQAYLFQQRQIQAFDIPPLILNTHWLRKNVSVVHRLHLLQLIGILKWDTISHMYESLILLVVPIHRVEVLMNWLSRISPRLRCVVSGVEEMFLRVEVRLTDPGKVDPCTFMVDPSIAFLADDPMKLMVLVLLVDALPLSNPRPILQLGVVVGPTFKDNPFAQADNNPFVNPFAPESSLKESSSGDDHPMDNLIGDPSRPISTRKQLATDDLWCFYNSILSKVEPKNFKTAMTKACWFEAIHEEIYEFDRLQLDEYGDVLKNKLDSSQVDIGQVEGIILRKSLHQDLRLWPKRPMQKAIFSILDVSITYVSITSINSNEVHKAAHNGKLPHRGM
ncbi:hypothetical protein Tco_0728032 [Tanacetum coccineum]|uniref:Integrase, catalytic region, zinc finger, CCHC-type, peptidase aspartic, catalytic n=1 Tax=Tanacetum coccineum TaxID=301880 RepID=A0ABQ4YMC2_9ASTR